MTAAQFHGPIARREKDGYLPLSEIEKMAGKLNSEGLDVLDAELDLSLAKVRAKLEFKLERVRHELHERAA